MRIPAEFRQPRMRKSFSLWKTSHDFFEKVFSIFYGAEGVEPFLFLFSILILQVEKYFRKDDFIWAAGQRAVQPVCADLYAMTFFLPGPRRGSLGGGPWGPRLQIGRGREPIFF